MRISTLLVTAVMMSVAFAGCSGDDGPANADFLATPMNAEKSSYKFDASNSTGSGLVYTWDFGDQSPPGTGVTAEHTYQYLGGKYTVKLTVVDAAGVTSEKTQKIQVGTGDNTDPKLYLTTDTRWIAPGGTVTFDATQSFDEDGDPIIFKWNFNDLRAEGDFNSLENLGSHAYGIYKYGPPAESPAANESGNGSGEGGLLLTPSGHVWADEYQKAQERLMDLTGVSTFDGNHTVVPETRNEAFDGKITDTSPIQIFTFPDPATYFVHVQVVDIKGDYNEGFIRIKVDPNVPESTFAYDNSTSLQSSAFGVLGEATSPQPYFWKIPFSADYPARFEITMTFEPEPAGTPATVGGYVCAANFDVNGCKGKQPNMNPWESGAMLPFELGASAVPGAYQVIFVMEGDATQGQTPSSGAAVTVNIVGSIFVNPWFKSEAGLGGH